MLSFSSTGTKLKGERGGLKGGMGGGRRGAGGMEENISRLQ